MASAAKGSLLCRTDFPLYTIRALDDHHFLVAGGGGQVKTGVTNAIEIYELHYANGEYSAGSLCRHTTDTQAVMNSDSFYDGRHHTFAAGMDDQCHVYDVKYRVVSPAESDAAPNQNPAEGIRKRTTTTKDDESEASSDDVTKTVTFDVTPISQTTTDFSPDGSFQKVVRFSCDHGCLATGGADGHLRIWKYPGMTKLHDIAAHECDIDDIDFSLDNKHIVSIGRDGTSCVWNVSDGKQHSSLTWTATQWEPYRCRACRFGRVIDKDTSRLYTITIPSKRRTKNSQSYLASWDTKNYKLQKTVRTGTEILSALAVSRDGVYLGVGTISGSVAVYISFSLQKLYNVREIHDIFVTGLDFLPTTDTSLSLCHSTDCSLLSISADNTVRLHQVSSREPYSFVWVLVGVLAIIALFFWVIGELSL